MLFPTWMVTKDSSNMYMRGVVFSGMLWTKLCSPNEDFVRLNRGSGVSFRGTFQGDSYTICYKPLKTTSKRYNKSFVHPSKIIVWDGKVVTTDQSIPEKTNTSWHRITPHATIFCIILQSCYNRSEHPRKTNTSHRMLRRKLSLVWLRHLRRFGHHSAMKGVQRPLSPSE